jgi:hypothetical protein
MPIDIGGDAIRGCPHPQVHRTVARPHPSRHSLSLLCHMLGLPPLKVIGSVVNEALNNSKH